MEELAEEMTSDALFGTEGVAPISFDLELDEPEDIDGKSEVDDFYSIKDQAILKAIELCKQK